MRSDYLLIRDGCQHSGGKVSMYGRSASGRSDQKTGAHLQGGHWM